MEIRKVVSACRNSSNTVFDVLKIRYKVVPVWREVSVYVALHDCSEH